MPYSYTHHVFGQGLPTETLLAGKETIIAVTPAIDAGPTNGTVFLGGTAVLQTAAETTQVIIRIRRGSLTGQEVAKVETKPGASTETAIPIQGEDVPGEVSGLRYYLTAQDVAKKESQSKSSTVEATW